MKCRYRGKKFQELESGFSDVSAGRTVTEADTVMFGCLTGDMNPLHTNDIFAAQSPHGRRIAHGAFGQALMIGLAAQLGIFEGTTVALRQIDTRFKSPIYIGDTVYLTMEVESKRQLKTPDQGLVVFNAKLLNQDDKVLVKSKWSVLMNDGQET